MLFGGEGELLPLKSPANLIILILNNQLRYKIYSTLALVKQRGKAMH